MYQRKENFYCFYLCRFQKTHKKHNFFLKGLIREEGIGYTYSTLWRKGLKLIVIR